MSDNYQPLKRISIQSTILESFLDSKNDSSRHNLFITNKEWIIVGMNHSYDLINRKNQEYHSDIFDIFSQITPEEIFRLRTCPTTLFMFNYLWEGHSYLEYNFWELLTLSELRHDIPREKIFFISSNLKEEISYDHWQKKYYPNDRINVISFNFFGSFTQRSSLYDKSAYVEQTIDDTVKNIKENQKYFLNLNRRKRHFRTYTIYKIFKSKIFNNTLMSYYKLCHNDYNFNKLDDSSGMDKSTIERLIESSPSVLDFSDFERNWVEEFPNKLFNESMISLVSETLFETNNETSLFYSEKTFRPMMYYHPVLIFGQSELNMSLNQIGFKTYDKYFDLSFDVTKNHYERIDSQIEQLEILNDKLSMMSVSQRIDWLLQDRETLEYNRESLKVNTYNKNKITILEDIVRSITE